MAPASRFRGVFVAEDWDGHGWKIAEALKCSIMDELHGMRTRLQIMMMCVFAAFVWMCAAALAAAQTKWGVTACVCVSSFRPLQVLYILFPLVLPFSVMSFHIFKVFNINMYTCLIGLLGLACLSKSLLPLRRDKLCFLLRFWIKCVN